jgi:AhpD family alkylhydroperoxidase
MTRIERLPHSKAGPVTRLTLRIARRKTGQLAGRDTERMIEPLELFAYAPRLLFGYGMLELANEKVSKVDHRLKELAQLKAATLTNCEYCIDIGSSIARRAGLSDEQLLALPHYRDSDLFSDLDKLVLDYAVGMSSTPVDVSDELFGALREQFDEAQMVELTSVIALENLRGRFNLALGIGAAGFSEGMVCAIPERSPVGADTSPAAERTAAGGDVGRAGGEKRPVGANTSLAGVEGGPAETSPATDRNDANAGAVAIPARSL